MSQSPFFQTLFTSVTTGELDRYLAGQSPPDELKRLNALFQSDAEGRELMVSLKQGVWKSTLEAAPAFSTDLESGIARAHVAQRLGVFPGERVPRTTPTVGALRSGTVSPRRTHTLDSKIPLNTRRTRWWFAGGAGLLAGVCGLVVLRYAPQFERTASMESHTYVHQTEAAQRASLDLPDGSVIHLAPMTRVEYSSSDNGVHVTLHGQAAFEVRTDPRRSFTVNAGATVTRVLGTVFDVRHYDDDSVTVVTVSSGKVATSGSRASAIVTPGSLARMTDSTAVTASVPTQAMRSWMNGHLVFRGASVRAMLADLERWTGYRFRLADEQLGRRTVNTMLDVNNPAEVMNALRDLLDVTLEIQDDVVTLRPSTRRRPAQRHDTLERRQGIYPQSMEQGK